MELCNCTAFHPIVFVFDWTVEAETLKKVGTKMSKTSKSSSATNLAHNYNNNTSPKLNIKQSTLL